MKKTLIFTAMAALLVFGYPAKASISWTTYLTQDGANSSQPVVRVQCDSEFVAPNLYTYTYVFTVGDNVFTPGSGYVFTPISDDPVTSFVIDTPYAIPGSGTSALGTASITIGNNEVVWTYAGPSFPGTDTVSFQSPYGAPDLGNARAIDGSSGISWSSGNPGVLVPMPGVPEASTVTAAMLMLIPLGAGAVRAIYRQRLIKELFSRLI